MDLILRGGRGKGRARKGEGRRGGREREGWEREGPGTPKYVGLEPTVV